LSSFPPHQLNNATPFLPIIRAAFIPEPNFAHTQRQISPCTSMQQWWRDPRRQIMTVNKAKLNLKNSKCSHWCGDLLLCYNGWLSVWVLCTYLHTYFLYSLQISSLTLQFMKAMKWVKLSTDTWNWVLIQKMLDLILPRLDLALKMQVMQICN
jgi:hypothetical protein